MTRFVLVLLVCVAIGILYSWLINRFTSNKPLFFIPTIIGAFWFLYIFTLYKPNANEGFEGLIIVIYAMMVLSLMVGNIISSIYFIYKKRNH